MRKGRSHFYQSDEAVQKECLSTSLVKYLTPQMKTAKWSVESFEGGIQVFEKAALDA
jgi:hypothetical protein